MTFFFWLNSLYYNFQILFKQEGCTSGFVIYATRAMYVFDLETWFDLVSTFFRLIFKYSYMCHYHRN